MTPEELREILNLRKENTPKTDPEMWEFYLWAPDSWGCAEYFDVVISVFSDEELMQHYARFLLERES